MPWYFCLSTASCWYFGFDELLTPHVAALLDVMVAELLHNNEMAVSLSSRLLCNSLRLLKIL
jgi:hypothetical protein